MYSASVYGDRLNHEPRHDRRWRQGRSQSTEFGHLCVTLIYIDTMGFCVYSLLLLEHHCLYCELSTKGWHWHVGCRQHCTHGLDAVNTVVRQCHGSLVALYCSAWHLCWQLTDAESIPGLRKGRSVSSCFFTFAVINLLVFQVTQKLFCIIINYIQRHSSSIQWWIHHSRTTYLPVQHHDQVNKLTHTPVVFWEKVLCVWEEGCKRRLLTWRRVTVSNSIRIRRTRHRSQKDQVKENRVTCAQFVWT